MLASTRLFAKWGPRRVAVEALRAKFTAGSKLVWCKKACMCSPGTRTGCLKGFVQGFAMLPRVGSTLRFVSSNKAHSAIPGPRMRASCAVGVGRKPLQSPRQRFPTHRGGMTYGISLQSCINGFRQDAQILDNALSCEVFRQRWKSVDVNPVEAETGFLWLLCDG